MFASLRFFLLFFATTATTASSDLPRDTTPGVGWNLPERRKFLFRLEDVAFD
jgi:hypothetical protein